MDETAVAKNFSRYAHLYDKHADVQKKTGRRLLKCIGGKQFAKILELGSGTGNYTGLLRKRFTDAEIKAVDISERMVELSRNKLADNKLEFINADAQALNLNERFDLITSNACFHWLEGLETSLLMYKKHLKKNGLIAFTMFGPETFYELNAVLGLVLNNISTASSKFTSKSKLRSFLQEEFREVDIQEARYRERFSDLLGLLRKIKYSGVKGGDGVNRVTFNRKILKDIEKAYLFNFKGIKATYQVFFCLARK
jgi:malonyl-CoA O-methyltransferase